MSDPRQRTCNGNGDGTLEPASAASQTGERFGFWQHLANAGLVEGTYTGIAGSGDDKHSLVGENCPRSKISRAGWGTSYAAPSAYGTVGNRYTNVSTSAYNHFVLGANSGSGSGINSGVIMTPAEAWSIDKKVDDGRPALGNVVTFSAQICADVLDAQLAEYDFTQDSLQCWLMMKF